MFFIALFIVTLLTVTQAQAGSVDYLEWQLPGTGDAYSSPSVRFKTANRRLAGHDIKTSSFTGEVEVTGHVGQRFILCAKNIITDANFQTEARITNRTGTFIYLLQLSEKTASLSIGHSYPCPAVYHSQYPYSSALHLHSNAPFLVTYKAKPEKNQNNTGISLPFSSPAHPLSFILPGGKGGSDNDGDDSFRRPGFGAMPDKTGFDLLLLPALLPGNWQGYQSFFRLYQWLANDTARPPGLTLLLRFDNRPPIRLSISPAEYADMAEHLLNIRQLMQWLAPKLNGREQLVQKLLGISSQERFLPAETIDAVRRQLALALEQNDHDFSIEFEYSELLRTLTPAEDILNYPVITDGKTSENKAAGGSGQASGESGNSGNSGNNGASHSGGATGSGTSSESGSDNNGRDRDDDKPPTKLTTQCEASAIKGSTYLYICKIVVCEEEVEYSLTLVDNEYLPSFICGICFNICNNPHFFCRKHSFCKDCITAHSRQSPPNTCPSCRSSDKDIHENFLLKQLTGMSRVYCPHRNSGCQDTPQIDQLQTHLEQCPHHVVHCKNEGCLLTYLSTEHSGHQKTCPFRTIDCVNSANGCKQKVIWNGMDAHTESCSYQKILCPDCENEILRHQSGSHKNECLCQKILCPDCEGEILRYQSGRHKKECPASAISHHSAPSNDYSPSGRPDLSCRLYRSYPHVLYSHDTSDSGDSSDSSNSKVSAESSDSEGYIEISIEPDYAGSDPDTIDGDFRYCYYGKKAILTKKKHNRLYIWNTEDFYPTTYFYALMGCEIDYFIKYRETKIVNYSHCSYAGVILKFCFKVRRNDDYLAVSYKHLNPDTKKCKPGSSHNIKVVKLGLYNRKGKFTNERCFHFDKKQFYKVRDKEFLPVEDIPQWQLPGGELVFYTCFYHHE